MEREALYYETLADGKVRCHLCPHNCTIADGKTGVCGVRVNRKGVLYTEIYGEVSSIAMDPIEKKPLYHFYPGSYILSIGTVGCSFHCDFCQNYTISQNPQHPTDYIAPEELVRLARQRGSIGVAYTYSEPFIWFEYVIDCCKLIRESGLKNVFVTNGYINPDPLKELLKLSDAFNIDLKSMNEDFYRRVIGGKLAAVMATIEEVSKHPRIMLEVTTLVIPGHNDSDGEMEKLSDFLASLRKDIPYHLSAYYPMYKFTAPPTPLQTLQRLQKIARQRLQYVYLGNVGGASNTYCPSCNALLIERYGYSIRRVNYHDGTCKSCGSVVPIIG